MRLFSKIILVFLMASCSAYGQINMTIGNYPEDTTPGNGLPHKHFRKFIGEFRFEQEPKPLTPTRVNFTLEVLPKRLFFPQGDWTLKIKYDSKYIELLSDSIFIWPGDKVEGDQFHGSIEFIPKVGGMNAFSLILLGCRPCFLDVQWCFDGEGKLTFLGRERTMTTPCEDIKTTFYDSDTITILERDESKRYNSMFGYSILITPPFKMGDTSTVTYSLKSNFYLPEGFDMDFSLFGMTGVEFPREYRSSINKEELIEISIKVIPHEINSRHYINVFFSSNIFDSGEKRVSKEIRCFSVFKESGELKYISDHDFYHLDLSHFPTNFRPYSYSKDSRQFEIIREDGSKDK